MPERILAGLLPVANLIAIVVGVQLVVALTVHRDHVAYEIKGRIARTASVLGIVFMILVWNDFSARHNLPEWWIFAALFVGTAFCSAVPILAGTIWASRQANRRS